MKCGKCLKEFNGWLALKNHENKIHGIKNFMEGHANVKAYQGGSAARQERETTADEKLHEAISRWKSRR